MNIVKTYGNYIKKYAGTHPAVSRKIRLTNRPDSGIIPTQNKEERQHPFSPPANSKEVNEEQGGSGCLVFRCYGCGMAALVFCL